MQFEELQAIWKCQDDEELFAIDEAALHDAIRRKSRSVTRWLELLEWMMIVVNFLVALFLVYDWSQEGGSLFQVVVAALYLGYAVYALVRRVTRQQAEVRFEQTMLGELDKAIWQVDRMIRWSRALPLWYLLPLALAGAASLYFNSTPWWKAALLLLLVPLTYIGVRWEINKWHLPKKQALTSLREQLLAIET